MFRRIKRIKDFTAFANMLRTKGAVKVKLVERHAFDIGDMYSFFFVDAYGFIYVVEFAGNKQRRYRGMKVEEVRPFRPFEDADMLSGRSQVLRLASEKAAELKSLMPDLQVQICDEKGQVLSDADIELVYVMAELSAQAESDLEMTA